MIKQNEIIKVEDCFSFEIQKEKMNSEYIAAFGYFDKALTVLFAKSGGGSIISFASAIGVPAGIASASFAPVFSLTTGIIKKVLKTTRNKKKKQ